MSYSWSLGASVLGDLADARAGDKGEDSLIAVYAKNPESTVMISGLLTPASVAHHFGMSPDDVKIRPATSDGAIVLVLHGRLGGGVTRAMTTDPHGKTLAYHLLEMPLSRPT